MMVQRQRMQEQTDKDTTYFGYRRVAKAEKIRLVQDHFDTVAKRYDFTNTVLSFGQQQQWKKFAIKHLDLKAGDRVLDVCGGTADLALLAERVVGPAGRIVVYDINQPMMAKGRHKVVRANAADRILFMQGDAEDLAVADESCNAAMVGFGIRNLTSMERGLEEMYRVLKPGGKFLCLDFSQPVSGWFRLLYDFYSFHVMPLVGKLLVGSREAYTYLPESIRMFVSPDELSQMLRRVGFRYVSHHLLSNGIAVVHVGVKAR